MDARRPDSKYVLLDEKGNQRDLLRLDQSAVHPRFSPDGRRLALNVTAHGASSDIWIKDLDRDTFSRLTFLEGRNDFPVRTPDGNAILFQNSGAKLTV